MHIDKHFARTLLILVGALLIFSFWFYYEQSKDFPTEDRLELAAPSAAPENVASDPILIDLLEEDVDLDLDLGAIETDIDFSDIDF